MKEELALIKAKELALAAATRSTALKRKVGCTIIYRDAKGEYGFAVGYNLLRVLKAGEWTATDLACEDTDGQTISGDTARVFHAEENAVIAFQKLAKHQELSIVKVVVTHPPCDNCKQVLHKCWPYVSVYVIEEFIKFDKDKLRYDLLPVLAIEEIVRNITIGAKKYKPNNWRNTPDLDRYIAAAMRHLEAHRKGELVDEGQGCLHIAMAATNLLFITELLLEKTK